MRGRSCPDPHRPCALALALALAAHAPFAVADCEQVRIDSPEPSAGLDPTALQRQSAALRGMALESVEYSGHGPVRDLVADTGIVLPPDLPFRLVGGPASDLLPLLKDVLLARGTETLTIKENGVWFGDERTLQLLESIRGIPVLHGSVSLSYNARSRRVSGVTAHFVPDRDLPAGPQLAAGEAKQALRTALAFAEKLDPGGVLISEAPFLGYFARFGEPGPAHLVWAITAAVRGEREEFLVDSQTGMVVYRRPLSLSIVGRREPPREVTGTRCRCAGEKSFIPAGPIRHLPNCGRLVSMNWSPLPGVDRYVALASLPELGWVFSDLVIDGSSPQCVCEVPRTVQIRMQACNSCGCGPWSKVTNVHVEAACPLPDAQAGD